jgi:hypothetical protein
MAAGDPSHLVVMNYDLGSPFHPVMTVATVDCPAIASSDGLSLSPPDTASAAIPDLPITETSSHPNAPATAKELDQVNWSFLLAHSSIAARGTLLEKESSFVLLEGRPTGLAHLRLAIQEAISGPVPETLDVWATGVTFPGKLTYVGWSGFPMYDELSIGQDILVFATLTGSTAWTNNHRVFILQDQSPQTTSALSSIRSLAGHMTPRDQMGNADLVVLAKPRSDPAVLAVVATYRGTAPGESIRVNHSTAERIAYAQSRYNSTMQGVLCFLFLSQDGEYALVCGNRSLFVVATDAIHDLNSARLVPATLCYPK